MARKKVDVNHLIAAAILAARADHYLIRIVDVRPIDASRAKQVLINMENAGEISEDEMDRALYFLAEAAGVREQEL